MTHTPTSGSNMHPAPSALPESTTAQQHSSQHSHEALPQHVAWDSHHGAAASRQHSGAGSDQPSTTADPVLNAQHHAATAQQDLAVETGQARMTADRVLDAVLDQVDGDYSRQRTTADCVLDSVLADVSSAGLHSRAGRLQAAAGTARGADSNGLDEAQDEGYISQVCLVWLRLMHLIGA